MSNIWKAAAVKRFIYDDVSCQGIEARYFWWSMLAHIFEQTSTNSIQKQFLIIK